MVCLVAESRKKGFMHALEGLIAAIVLFFYFSSASLPPLQDNEWTYNSMRQTGAEYITSIEKSESAEQMVRDSKVFSKITNSLFETSDISVMKNGVPPKDLIVGITGSSGNEKVVVGGVSRPASWCYTRNWYPDSDPRPDCIVNDTNGLGKRTVLADINKDYVYDAVYVDMNGDSNYDAPLDGPYAEGGYLSIGSTNYYVKYIDSDDEIIKFVNVTSFDYFKNIQNTSINGMRTRFVYYVADLAGDISQYDVILITGSTNLTPYSAKLKNFLLSGKGIVEVRNITNSNYNPAQKDLFGLVKASYGIIENGDDVYLSDNSRSVSEPLTIRDYFSALSFRLYMIPPSSPPYDVTGLSMPMSVRAGFLNLTSGTVGIAISRIGTSYDALYVDSNMDYNFSNPPQDALPHFAGESFNTSSYEYIVAAIDAGGNYTDVRPSYNASLTGFLNPLLIIPDENSWAAAEQADTYHANAMALFDFFNISFAETPVLGNQSTLIFGNHTYGRINITDYYVMYLSGGYPLGNPATLPAGVHSYASATTPFFDREYNISVTDVGAGSFRLNIDLNENLAYNNVGEGPFSNNSVFTAGSAEYRIFFIDQNYTNLTRLTTVYNASITNISGSLFINIDLNDDSRYDGIGEGPFANTETFKIGPENYRVDIAKDRYSAKFTLYKRDAVPAAIASNKNTGRTVWLPDMTKGGIDSWSYLSAAILWAAPKNEDILKSAGYSNIISNKKVFIVNKGGIFQPYVVEISRRYG